MALVARADLVMHAALGMAGSALERRTFKPKALVATQTRGVLMLAG